MNTQFNPETAFNGFLASGVAHAAIFDNGDHQPREFKAADLLLGGKGIDVISNPQIKLAQASVKQSAVCAPGG